jgi:hypothetical protein
VTQRRITPLGGETAVANAPRMQLARKRTPPPALSAAGCWTDSRLRNLPVMISTMLSSAACSDTMFAEVVEVVDREKRRRTAATA